MPLSKKDRRALALCGGFLGLAALYVGIIDPWVERYGAALDKIASIDKKSKGLASEKRMLQPRQRKLRSARVELEELLRVAGGEVPRSDHLSFCIRSLQSAATTTGAALHSIRPLPAPDEVDPHFSGYRFELNFSGSYATVQRMLHHLETGAFLHITRQMDLNFDKELVTCRMLAERYFYEREAPPAETEGAPGGTEAQPEASGADAVDRSKARPKREAAAE